MLRDDSIAKIPQRACLWNSRTLVIAQGGREVCSAWRATTGLQACPGWGMRQQGGRRGFAVPRDRGSRRRPEKAEPQGLTHSLALGICTAQPGPVAQLV